MSKLIETPYGRKTPELLTQAMDAHTLQPKLLKMINDLEEHLDFCGWGDRYERECSEGLRTELDALHIELKKKGLE